MPRTKKERVVELAVECIRENGPSSAKEIVGWVSVRKTIKNGVSVHTLSNLLRVNGTFVKSGSMRFAMSGEVVLWDIVIA